MVIIVSLHISGGGARGEPRARTKNFGMGVFVGKMEKNYF
jgi:hypothetical protein